MREFQNITFVKIKPPLRENQMQEDEKKIANA
jgi:hypothetical protein